MSLGRNEVKERPLEDELDHQLREAGLAGYYERNVTFIPGRKFRADFWFAGEECAVEVDGGIFMAGKSGHTSGVGYHSDRVRDQLARAHGIETLRFTTPQVKSGEALAYLRAYLPERGREVAESTPRSFRDSLPKDYGKDTSGRKKKKRVKRDGAK